MLWKKLSETTEEHFFRGVVLRFPAHSPFEETVDFMFVSDPHSPSGFSAICTTGYHAGQIEVAFPEESRHEMGNLSVGWLRENWQRWVYPDCSVADVLYRENYCPQIGGSG